MTDDIENPAAERLQRVYDLAKGPLRRYLAAEIAYLLECIPPGGRVLELGCGYGRILFSSDAEAVSGERLAWFRRQAHHGLRGPIDEDATGGGRA